MAITGRRSIRDYLLMFLLVAAVLVLLLGIYVREIQALLPIASLLLALRILMQSDDRNVRRFAGVLTFGFAASTLSNIAWYLVPAVVQNDFVLTDNYYYITGMFWILGYAAIAYVLLHLKNSRQWYIEQKLDRGLTASGAVLLLLVALFVFLNINWGGTHLVDIFILLIYLGLDIMVLILAVKLLSMNVKIELRHLVWATLFFFLINMAGDLLFESRWLFHLSKLLTLQIGSYQTTLTIRDATNDIYNVSLMLMTVLLFLFTLDPLRSRKIDEMRGKLKDTQLFVDDLIAKSPDATCIFDRNGQLMLVNDSFLDIFGLKRHEVDRSFNIFGHFGEKLFLDDAYVEILKVRDSGTVIIPKLKIKGVPGGRQEGFYLYLKMFPTYSSDGRISNYVMIIEDITARIEMENALRQSEEKFRAIFEQAAVGIAYVELDGQFASVNNKYCDITRYSHDEMVRLNYQDITFAEDHALDEMIVQDLLGGISTRRTIEKRYVRKDGSMVWVSMTVSLVKDVNGMPRCFIAVAEDITDRKRLEGDLLRAYDSLKVEYERKIDFTNAAAHELRTPLTPIIGYTDILKDEVKDERHRRFLEIIERNALRQKNLVNRMLELASLDAGMAHVNRAEMAVRPLALEIADNYRTVNPHIRVEVPDGMLIHTDPDILRHVLDNLVSNAVKYSDREQEIEIRAEESGDGFQFSVKDHGSGIPKEEWGKIFERFYIVGGDSDSRTSGRSGLGLALVKAYIRLIGGDVWLESEPGRGSTFFFTIPGKPSDKGHGC